VGHADGWYLSVEWGHTLDELLDNFPSVSRGQAIALLEQATVPFLAGIPRAA
jgi:hypothetical protein